jgi:hypothetical protein
VKLGIALGLTLVFGNVFPGMAQNRSGSRMTAPPQAPQVRPSDGLHLPTSPILPMSNPVLPMTTAPVQPFVRYQGPYGTPTVVVPPADAHVGDRRRGRNPGSGVIYVPYEYLNYAPEVYEPAPVAPPTPGYLPGMDPGRLPSTTSEPVPAAQAPIPPPVSPQPTYSDNNIVITPVAPLRVVEPPALGTTRVDAIARYGEPWGRVNIRGKDTLYFNGGLALVFENDRVVEVR